MTEACAAWESRCSIGCILLLINSLSLVFFCAQFLMLVFHCPSSFCCWFPLNFFGGLSYWLLVLHQPALSVWTSRIMYKPLILRLWLSQLSCCKWACRSSSRCGFSPTLILMYSKFAFFLCLILVSRGVMYIFSNAINLVSSYLFCIY